MSMIYELIGRTVVTVVRVRFRRQIRIAAAAAVLAAAAAVYLAASRDVEEG
jgi:hypothetical protein